MAGFDEFKKNGWRFKVRAMGVTRYRNRQQHLRQPQ